MDPGTLSTAVTASGYDDTGKGGAWGLMCSDWLPVSWQEDL